MLNSNCWIVTAIDYATSWLVACVLKEAIEEGITHFLYKEIFINYGVPCELLSDNGSNLMASVMQHYIHILQT